MGARHAVTATGKRGSCRGGGAGRGGPRAEGGRGGWVPGTPWEGLGKYRHTDGKRELQTAGKAELPRTLTRLHMQGHPRVPRSVSGGAGAHCPVSAGCLCPLASSSFSAGRGARRERALRTSFRSSQHRELCLFLEVSFLFFCFSQRTLGTMQPKFSFPERWLGSSSGSLACVPSCPCALPGIPGARPPVMCAWLRVSVYL